jgi:predicted nucleic acid-binding protein
MAIVVDTNIVSFLFKRDTRAELYRQHLTNTQKLISFMTLAELRRWALERNWGNKRRDELEEFLLDYAVVFADNELCNLWAKAVTDCKRNGRPIDTADAWIASVALLFDIPLVTHNRSHFEGVDGLKIISEESS